MKRFAKYLGLTATALALTVFAAAEDTPRNSAASANQLVPANAELQQILSTKTAKQGDTITAKLTQTVHLSGTTLPRNTVLVGHVDSAQSSENKGVSKVVLTFDQAKLENGQNVAIKSTLVGVYPAGTLLTLPNISPELEVDQQPSGSHGFSLESSVQGANSGTLSANGKDVHITKGMELQFIVSPASGAATSSTGN